MIILSETTDNLQIVLDTSPASECEVLTSWRDRTSTTFVAGRSLSKSNGTSNVTIAAAPAASTQRVIDLVTVYNPDSSAVNVTVIFNANAVQYLLFKGTLDSRSTLTYTNEGGFFINNAFQSIKSFKVHGDAGVNFAMTNATLAERFAGNTTRHLFIADLLGYTQVRFRVNKQVVGTAGSIFRAKYYTSYNTTVTNFLQLGLSGQIETSMAATGYYDSGWQDLAIGARINGCCIGFTELGGDGVADPAIGATDILFR